MGFVERKFEEKDYQEYKGLLGAGDNVRLPYPYHWMVDDDSGIQIFELGGRGEMPASTGAPPNAYVLVMNSLIYKFGLRCNSVRGGGGGIISKYTIETMEVSKESLLTRCEIISILREALIACVARRRTRLKMSMPEDVIVMDE